MNDATSDPATAPVPSAEKTGPGAARRPAVLLGIGGGVGLALGVLLTLGVFAVYTFFTRTLPSTRDSVQVFNELNELRQQLNRLDEEKKLKEQEKEAVRQALGGVASTVRTPAGGTPGVAAPAKKQGGGASVPPVEKARGDFADVDGEIERLEQTQKVLNIMLDLLTRKGKERAKDR